MDILGVGPLEIIFILLIALIVLGPRDMAKTGRSMGRVMRKIVMSPYWKTITHTSQEIRNLPTRLIREAGLEEVEKDLARLNQETNQIQEALRQATILPPTRKSLDSSPSQLDNAVFTSPENPGTAGISPVDQPVSTSTTIKEDREDRPSIQSGDLLDWIQSPNTRQELSKQDPLEQVDLSEWISPVDPDQGAQRPIHFADE